ncbi:MAG: zinc-dependent metalloprotease [Bacteroidetes bacterium]|nr:zinc-dependent metalloprotease [Bacteroidota bacterium]
MKKTLVAATLASLAFSGGIASAQERICGTDIAIQHLIANNPQLESAYTQYEADVKQRTAALEAQNTNAAQKTTATYNVPVVFHVVLSQAQIDEIGGVSGIYDRIASQIDVLNTCYTGQNYNTDKGKILTQFQPLFGNPNITFGIAHTDPNGGGTTGVEIKIAPATFTGFDVTDNNIKKSSGGGFTTWDTKYVNIWITHITTASNGGQVLGYAYNPGLAQSMGDASLAGVVIDYLAFGRRSSIRQKFFGTADKGKTLVHELGHYFTLKHIWGDLPVGGGTCDKTQPHSDDDVADTPPQKDANQSTCPSGVKPNCTNSPGGEMYMNYMDYVQDACMVMFSKGQVTRMQTEFTPAGGSYQLQFNGGTLNWPTGISAVEAKNTFDIVPNPSNGVFSINFANTTADLRAVTVVNMMGQSVKQINTTEPANSLLIDMKGMPAGVYTVNCRFDEGIVTKKIVIE